MQHEHMVNILKQAIAHHKADQLADAEPLYRQVLDYSPNTPTALQNLGLILSQAGKHREAVELLQRAVEADPTSASCYRNLGAVLHGAKKFEEAAVALRKGIAFAPEEGLYWVALALSLDLAGNFIDAMAAYERGIRLLAPLVAPAQPSDPLPNDATAAMELGRARYNLGCIWGRLGDVNAAMAEYAACIRLLPAYGEPHFARAVGLFKLGSMAEAWAEYEWRWRCTNWPGQFPDFRRPVWDGSDLNGKTILIWWEQGLGDTIQFCRYVSLVKARGARVILQCQKELRRLLQTLAGPDELIVDGERRIEWDFHASLMSMPALFKTNLDTIPSGKAYLRADPQDSVAWRKRFTADGPGFRVGLVWAGAVAHRENHLRSIPLVAFAPILRIPGVKFYSLQFGNASKELEDLSPGQVADHTAGIHDFADSAAFIGQLDLLITVDTAAAHLAGAIGKETRMLLASPPEFRWMHDTDDPSRWYPTMRLFRQVTAGDWKPVILKIARELEARVKRTV